MEMDPSVRRKQCPQLIELAGELVPRATILILSPIKSHMNMVIMIKAADKNLAGPAAGTNVVVVWC
jgi:hypothetical protein